MDTTSNTERAAALLERIRAIHEQTTWDAIRKLKRQRDELIREALGLGVLTPRQLAEGLNMSEQHLGRIEKGETSGAQRRHDQ